MTPVKVRVSVSSDPAVGLPAMVGYSIAGHVVAFAILILAPRVMPRTPPPPLILSGQIVSLPPPAGTPSAPPAARHENSQQPAEPQPPPKSPRSEAPPPPPRKEKAPAPPGTKKAADVVPPEPGKERAPKEEPRKEESPAAIALGVGLVPAGEAGGIPSINSAAFPYDWYRATIVNLVRSQWRRPVTPGLTQPLRCSVSFVISRGGALSDVTVAASSGFQTLDLSAVRAVTDSSPLPQLPYQYTADSIRAELVFELTPD